MIFHALKKKYTDNFGCYMRDGDLGTINTYGIPTVRKAGIIVTVVFGVLTFVSIVMLIFLNKRRCCRN